MPSPEASRNNLEKARTRWRAPRPWRSAHESRVIKRLVWQWFLSREPGKWSSRAVARWLGVSHTWIQKLVRQFATDPSEIQRDLRRHVPATFEQLRHAKEETRKEKERGWLRPPLRWRKAEFKIGDSVVRTVIPTKAEEYRQAEIASGGILGPTSLPPHDFPLWARGLPYYSPDNPCDPLVAVKHATQNRKTRSVFALRQSDPGKVESRSQKWL